MRLLITLSIMAGTLAAEHVAVGGSLRTRVESWDWFGDGYTFSGTLGRLSFSKKTWQVEFAAPLLLGLPGNATGGVGLNYFNANHRRRNAGMVFLKQANFTVGGLKIGRFEFNDGSEVIPKDPTLAALKRDRISQRLIGNFGWTHAGRSLDGFHFAANKKVSVHWVTGAPTRGVFQVDGWGTLRTAISYFSVNRADGNRDWRLFGIYYHDWRPFLRQSIRLGTYGGHYLHTNKGADVLVWGALQNGRWTSTNQFSGALALEAGFQPQAKLRPWLRGGYYHGSGKFFQLLPTPRPFARFPFFNMMNNRDVHGSLALRPAKTVTIKSEAHHLRLASRQDPWWIGGGAFQPWTLGFAGRPSRGFTSLANLYDLSVDWAANAHFALSTYFGHAQGLRVLDSKHGNLGYIELTYKF